MSAIRSAKRPTRLRRPGHTNTGTPTRRHDVHTLVLPLIPIPRTAPEHVAGLRESAGDLCPYSYERTNPPKCFTQVCAILCGIFPICTTSPWRRWIHAPTNVPIAEILRSRLISSAGAECVSAPTEIRSTPVSAIARTVVRLTPPDASRIARPPRDRDRLAHHLDRHVVEQDDLGAGSQRQLELIEVRDLDLDLDRVRNPAARPNDRLADRLDPHPARRCGCP